MPLNEILWYIFLYLPQLIFDLGCNFMLCGFGSREDSRFPDLLILLYFGS